DLIAGVDYALSLGWVDGGRLYVTGGSYGGFMTNWVIGRTDRFKAAATQRSISNNISAFGTSDIGWHFWEHEMGGATPWRDGEKLIDRSPLTYVNKVETPLLILHAERDLRCPIEQAEQLVVALKGLGSGAVFVGLAARPPGQFCFVAEDAGLVVGYALGGPERSADTEYRGEVYAIYVLAAHQGRGLGRALIRESARELANAGITSLLIWVLREN